MFITKNYHKILQKLVTFFAIWGMKENLFFRFCENSILPTIRKDKILTFENFISFWKVKILFIKNIKSTYFIFPFRQSVIIIQLMIIKIWILLSLKALICDKIDIFVTHWDILERIKQRKHRQVEFYGFANTIHL